MAAKLVAEEGSLKGLILSLEDGDHWVIGRDPDACQLLVEDPSTSRKHLICRTTPRGILVENLSETNPTQVNDEEVKEPRLLQNGDAVKIGNGTFRFYVEAAAHLFKDAIPDEELVDTREAKKTNGEETPFAEERSSAPVETKKQPQKPDQEEPMESLLAEETPEQTTSKSESPMPPSPPPGEETELKDQPQEPLYEKEEERHHTIFEEEPSDVHTFSEINFGLLDTGRWLLKVINGPNNGAEFSMQTGNSYVIGTDPNACDIVFHDTSVSRQHARITISQEDVLTIEDLKSRNGTRIDEGEPLKSKQPLTPNTVIALGTTSFVIFDREGEMQTIISPLMPSIVKVLQTEEPKKTEEAKEAAAALAAQEQEASKQAEPPQNATLGAFILIGILTGLFVIVGIGTSTLFRSEPVAVAEIVDPSRILDSALAPFPSVKYSFNPNTGQLLLVGHLMSAMDKNQLLYALQGMPFIRSLDDSGVIIDEYVWREINQVLEKNPEWRGINVMATAPGHFVVSGYLQTRDQANRLSEYLSANFPYPELLERRVVVDQEIITSVNNILQGKGLRTIAAQLDNGEVVLSGGVPIGKSEEMVSAVADIKEIRGVRNVRNMTTGIAPEEAVTNITALYEVTGFSSQGGQLSVIINGRILMKGDTLDGMTISNIQSNVILLERDGTKYRIDFNR